MGQIISEMDTLGKQVRIVPKTRHMENRVSQHGSVWNIVSDDVHTGRVLVQSVGETFRAPDGKMEHDLRWVNRGEFVRL